MNFDYTDKKEKKKIFTTPRVYTKGGAKKSCSSRSLHLFVARRQRNKSA